MSNQTEKQPETPVRSKPDSLVSNWPLLLAAIAVAVLLMVLPWFDRDKVREEIRETVPGISAETSGAPEPADGEYRARYEAERKIREALHERLYGRKYQRVTEIEAEVVKRNPYEGYYTGDLLLNQGSENGVRVGMVVVNRDWVAVGQIVAVANATSTLRLITHPDLRMNVRVPGRNLDAMTSAAPSVAPPQGEVALQLPAPALFVSAIGEQELSGTGRERDRRDPQFLRSGDVVVTNGAADPANCADGIVVGHVSHTVPPETNATGWPVKASMLPGRLDSLRYVKIIVP
jgi:cell shape-determining protein MreC